MTDERATHQADLAARLLLEAGDLLPRGRMLLLKVLESGIDLIGSTR